VAGLDPDPVERRRERVGPGIDLAVAQPAVAVDQERTIRLHRRAQLERLRKRSAIEALVERHSASVGCSWERHGRAERADPRPNPQDSVATGARKTSMSVKDSP